jgi:hypothetical protein
VPPVESSAAVSVCVERISAHRVSDLADAAAVVPTKYGTISGTHGGQSHVG